MTMVIKFLPVRAGLALSELFRGRAMPPAFVPRSRDYGVVKNEETYFGAREATIFSKRGSPRSGSQ